MKENHKKELKAFSVRSYLSSLSVFVGKNYATEHKEHKELFWKKLCHRHEEHKGVILVLFAPLAADRQVCCK
jgi:hypothetical protein